ncbi:MAG TPA: hypothetical protein VFS93_08745 [Terrimesophilobacter sp.]|nr:hypothetical protein [Terrimesophilobacter sp.]
MRRLIRRIVAPYVRPLIDELRKDKLAIEELRVRNLEEISAMKKDLLATNHRINWLEEKLAAFEDAAGHR